jgi:hypothetical protein
LAEVAPYLSGADQGLRQQGAIAGLLRELAGLRETLQGAREIARSTRGISGCDQIVGHIVDRRVAPSQTTAGESAQRSTR